VQLATIGCKIKGDVKYGARRSNADGSIGLHARFLEIDHPTTKERIKIVAPVPDDSLWNVFEKQALNK
jgi:23S rRNA pseudouridine1911/1915/1917 synthase